MASTLSSIAKGFWNDVINSRLAIVYNGVEVARVTATAFTMLKAFAVTGGITATTGGVTVTAGGVTVTAGDVDVVAGRVVQKRTNTDVDAQNNTFTVAQLVAGILTHTSVTGAGTVTTDTAANYIAGSGGNGVLSYDGASIDCLYINDGNQTLTFSAGSNVTLGNVAQTLATNEAAVVTVTRVTSTTALLTIVGA